MDKRGQFTILVIVGLVVLVVTGIVLYFTTDIFTGEGISESVTYPSEIQEVADWTQECLEDLAREAVDDISVHAGHIDPDSDLAYAFQDTNIPYAYYEGSNLLLGSEQIVRNMGEVIEARAVQECYLLSPYLGDFELAVAGPVEVVASSNPELVEFEIDMPMTAGAGESLFQISNMYDVVVDARFEHVWIAAFNIVESSVFDPDVFDYDTILRQQVDTEILTMEDEVYVFVLRDSESYEEGEEYVFMFAGFFPLPEEEDPTFLNLLSEEALA